MSGPSVYLTWPTSFKLLPDPLPRALPPPVKERTFRSPFGIDKDLFNFALEPWIPITFAAVYIVTVFSLNAYNRSRGNKSWWIARQGLFHAFVVVHNVLLAIFSAATFAAMLRAIIHTWPEMRNNPHPAASIADALCKISGPRGLGDAATYNSTINIWEVKNTAIRLGYDGNPDPTDVGRLWNEGLAFWGWVFYVSKFYEVLDTFIILAKGKRSATLQTYHHAGAMLCMWAGIRYMSPPIWMFVFINSAIHAMMYTYFTFSALGYKVPQGLKRILTSLQIAQFVFGASYAAAHLFVAYDIPIQSTYQVAHIVQRAASSVSSAAVAATSSVSSIVATPTPRDWAAWTKKMLLRAAGEEGLAERVQDRYHQPLSEKIEQKIEHFNEQTWETRHRTDWTKVNCIDTTGEAFAIYLNIFYLMPLTGLFLRFFVRAYTQRGRPKRASEAPKQIADSSKQAEEETEKYIERRGEQIEDEIAQHGPGFGDKIRKDAHDLQEQLRNDVEQMKQGKFKGSRRVSDRVASFEGKAKTTLDKGKDQLNSAVEKAKQMTNGGDSPSSERSGSPQKQRESAIEEDEAEEQQQGSGSPKKGGKKQQQKGGDDGAKQGGKAEKSSESSQKPGADAEEDDSEHPQQQAKSGAQGADDEMRPKRQAEEATSQPEQSTKSAEDDKPEQSKKPAGDDKPEQSKPSGEDSKREQPKPSSDESKREGRTENQSPANKDDSPASKSRNASPRKIRQPSPSKLRQPSPSKQDPGSASKGEFISSPTKDAQSSQSRSGRSSPTKKPQSSQGKSGQGKENQSSRPPSSQGKGNKQSQSKEAADKNQSEKKQDENMADSQAVREGEKAGGKASKKAGDKSGGAGGKTGGDKKSQSKNSGGESREDNNEPEEKQEANMAGSQALRPGTSVEEVDSEGRKAASKSGQGEDKSAKTSNEDDEKDSDAMGQSGSIIDLAKEKANEARKEAESKEGLKGIDEEDPTAGAEPSGNQWTAPGDEGS
ncbi:hypothetical protein LTR17_021589 [Elasticomyces elasticus]|nr:hypothetical protein LTR17_021589 [Elasticomyces elasticus]